MSDVSVGRIVFLGASLCSFHLSGHILHGNRNVK